MGPAITPRGLNLNGALIYWIGRGFRRQGLMTEACAAVLQFSFTELELHKLIVGHFAGNAASENLIKRLGFRYIGEQVEEFRKDGVWHTHKLYELLAQDYFAATKHQNI